MPGFSCWLVPSPATSLPALRACVASLAAQHGGPVFAPHATLLGVIPAAGDDPAPLVETTRALAVAFPRRRVAIARAVAGVSEYRCVYLLLEREPALVALNAEAQARFGLAEAVFMPHVSLLYSAAVAADATACAAIAGGAFVARALEQLGGGVDFAALQLWDTRLAHANEWTLVQSFDLPEPT